MAKKENIASTNEPLLSWSAMEYVDHKQGFSWFLLLGLGSLGAGTVVYLITRDIFAVVIVLILGLIVGVFAHRTPRQLTYELSPDGLRIGEKFYPYAHFKSFSIIQDGPLVSLNLNSLKKFMPPISAYFEPVKQDEITEIVQNHLAYEERGLDPVDRLTRSLRF